MGSKILNGNSIESTRGTKTNLEEVDVNDQMKLYESLSNLNGHPPAEENLICDNLSSKSGDCFFSLPKTNGNGVSVESLIPKAARLILAKNRDADEVDYPAEFDEFETYDGISISVPDFSTDNSAYNDYGLEVIQEETASQMSGSESDSDEQDRCGEYFSETLRQRQRKPSFSSEDQTDYQQLDKFTNGSSQDGNKVKNSYNDEHQIAAKHIRIPSDWDPEPLLQRLYFIPEPKKEDFQAVHQPSESMAGHMMILSGNRKKGTFWNAWRRKFCIASNGKLDLYERDDCKDLFLSICLIGGKVDFLDPVEFVGVEKGKIMINRIIGLDDNKGHYYVLQCHSTGEASKWIEVLSQESQFGQKFAPPVLSKNPSMFRDIFLIEIGSSNIRAGVLTTLPSLPALFFPAVMSENESTGKKIFGSKVYLPENKKNVKIKFPFEPSSNLALNAIDVNALEGFLNFIFEELVIFPENYRFILTLHRRVDDKCRKSILQLLFNKYQAKGALLSNQSVMAFYSFSAENGIIVDVGERTDVLCLSQGFVFSNSWKKSHIGGHRLKHVLRQKMGPQENGLNLSTPTENLLLRYISENFVFINGMPSGRKMSQDSQEIIVEMDLRDLLPFSNLIGVDQEILKTVGEGFFEPELFGLDSAGIHILVHQALQDCGVDLRKEMSQNIFIVGGCTLIPGFMERLEAEVAKLCPPHLKPKITASPYRYHASYLGANILSQKEAFEKSIVKSQDYDDGPGPSFWCV